ncbi:Fatty acyl-CoA hydrolase precursor medium chain [Dissostichus eleginoides]|uniref:Fatty acyl-CoA hydrolase medium chain n=1 Tax=Dissostichus eleginoides TaxID=100907 RepID=A0AAD9BNH9_DISEL|nr:Fatty acyl-CoA hydrolase precursor medium chain [Dissostichus eleginoides]
MPKMCLQDTAPVEEAWKTVPLTYPSVEIPEDCLYLYVYRPTGTASGDKLPVMMWIHGGGLAAGGALQYDGSPLAAYQNVVVVVIQYRLSILGFLSKGDQHTPGNWGFLDQIAGLQWVRDNIAAFNGDPNSVTIFGQSAGGISVSMLELSPLAEDLFHKAIAMSGVAPLEAHYTSNPLAMAQMIANLSDCESSNSPPEKVLKHQEFQKVPIMIGLTNHEFGWMLPKLLGPPGGDHGMKREDVKSVMNMFFPARADSPENVRDVFTEILGDMVLVLPVLKVAAYHRDAGVAVYVYEFQHSPLMHGSTRPTFVKADHYDDALFFLGACFCTGHTVATGHVSQEEEELSKLAMAYIANFARSGSANGPRLSAKD